jgi:hypothetical protein
MGEDRMTNNLNKDGRRVGEPTIIDITSTVSEMNWKLGLERITRQFAATSGELAAYMNEEYAIPKEDSKLTKKGWYLAWRDMVSLCSRALQYKFEAERQAKHLEDKLQSRERELEEATNEYDEMVKSFDKLGEKYTKDTDALMKLLILLGRKIDE